MVEVANVVLHNVGNVLNSINVASSCIAENMKKSKAAFLPKVVALLREHEANLGTFLKDDPKGKQLPAYLIQLADHLANEHTSMLKELEQMQKHIEHIRDIVSMQQSCAKSAGKVEKLSVAELVDDALKMNSSTFSRNEIHVVKEVQEALSVTAEKHQVLQILVNLLRNAKQACEESGQPERKLVIRASNGDDRIRIAVSDNGVGIAPENI